MTEVGRHGRPIEELFRSDGMGHGSQTVRR
jgi:hypothetical protein